MAEFAKIFHNDYGLKRKHIKSRNPQSNAITKHIHKTIGNIIRTFDVSNIVNNNPWSGILAATMFAVRGNYHTILQASPMQLVFVRDAILNIKHVSDWWHIRQRKHLQINHNNKREYMRRNNHQYRVSDKILVKRKKNTKQELEFMGPFPITQINDNGTVRFQRVIIYDATNSYTTMTYRVSLQRLLHRRWQKKIKIRKTRKRGRRKYIVIKIWKLGVKISYLSGNWRIKGKK